MSEPTYTVYVAHRQGLDGPEVVRESIIKGEVRVEQEHDKISIFQPGMIEVIPFGPDDRIVIRCARIG